MASKIKGLSTLKAVSQAGLFTSVRVTCSHINIPLSSSGSEVTSRQWVVWVYTRWSPVWIWTYTPSGHVNHVYTDLCFSPFISVVLILQSSRQVSGKTVLSLRLPLSFPPPHLSQHLLLFGRLSAIMYYMIIGADGISDGEGMTPSDLKRLWPPPPLSLNIVTNIAGKTRVMLHL